MTDRANLEGQIAVVTGASRGIGKAIAKELAAQGATVVINYNGSEAKADEVKHEIVEKGGCAQCMQCNVADYEGCEAFIKAVIEQFGRIDILVNNAGITKDGLLMRMSEEDFSDVIDVNLKGTFHCIRFASRQMMKQRSGKIINLASVVGISGNAGQVNYAASKAGVIGMTKSMAKELANGTFPVAARPAATPIILPSAIPQSMCLSGNTFWKIAVLVAPARSASSTTRSSCSFPISTRAFP